MTEKKNETEETQGVETVEETVETVEDTEDTTEDISEEEITFMESIKVGDVVEFYPTGAKEPKTVTVDEAFLKLQLSEEIIKKHKYAKV